MIDYHNHTKLCKHAEGEVSDFIEKAIELGINEFAFTDHIPLPDSYDIAHRMQMEEIEDYIKWIENARVKYPEIKILTGIEAEYIEGFEDFTDQFLQQYNFDIVIMSVHFIKSWTGRNWVFKYDFPDKTLPQIYSEYINTVNEGIKTNLFDVVGHIDLVKKPGFPLMQEVAEEVHNVLNNIKKHNMVLEINTSGYRRKIAEPYPSTDWMQSVKKLEIPISVGSDAHSPDQVGLNFINVYHNLANMGINEFAHFDKRKFTLKPTVKDINNGRHKKNF